MTSTTEASYANDDYAHEDTRSLWPPRPLHPSRSPHRTIAEAYATEGAAPESSGTVAPAVIARQLIVLN